MNFSILSASILVHQIASVHQKLLLLLYHQIASVCQKLQLQSTITTITVLPDWFIFQGLLLYYCYRTIMVSILNHDSTSCFVCLIYIVPSNLFSLLIEFSLSLPLIINVLKSFMSSSKSVTLSSTSSIPPFSTSWFCLLFIQVMLVAGRTAEDSFCVKL